MTGDLGPAAADVYGRLIADPALLDCDELYFNAGRLDRSVALASEDYVRLAGPPHRPHHRHLTRLPGHGQIDGPGRLDPGSL